jgi:hypothetical protein
MFTKYYLPCELWVYFLGTLYGTLPILPIAGSNFELAIIEGSFIHEQGVIHPWVRVIHHPWVEPYVWLTRAFESSVHYVHF